MNKNIKSEIAFGIISLIAIIMGGLVWLSEKEHSEDPISISGQTFNSQEKKIETNSLPENNTLELRENKTVNIEKKEVPKIMDYEVRNLKIKPLTPSINELVTLTFDIYNKGQGDLPGSNYEVTKWGEANIIDDISKSTCKDSTVINPGTSCKVEKKISYSTHGAYTISVMADNAQMFVESDEKNNFASLEFKTEPAVRLISPNGGETLRVGEKYKIKWHVDTKKPSRIQLYVFNSNTNGLNSISESIDANDEYYNWIVPTFDDLPGIGGKDYKIRIMELETNTVYDESDSKFSIISK
jgi:hypothetical protein